MIAASKLEIEKKLKQLTFIAKLDTPDASPEEHKTVRDIYMDIAAWLAEHHILYCYDEDAHKYVETGS